MFLRSRSVLFALTVGLIMTIGQTSNAAMTLQFGITPTVLPMSGSVDRFADGTIVATNLAVTSVTSVETAKVVSLLKYLNFQSAGDTGANFFILDGLVQQSAGTPPVAMTSPAISTSLITRGTGFLFTMLIGNGCVSSELAGEFGIAGGSGWTGIMTLNIATFDPALKSSQVTSGTILLTAPAINPAVVPEPASVLMAGMGFLIVVGRFGAMTARSKKLSA